MRKAASSPNKRSDAKAEIRFREYLGDGVRPALSRKQHAVSLWLRLMKTYNLVLREARTSLQNDLTLPQFDVIAQLHREPEGLTQAELTRRLLVTSANLTGIVRRLQSQGLVRREQHHRDRRAVRLQLTKKGERFAQAAEAKHADALSELFHSVPFKDQRLLRETLGRVNRKLEGCCQARQRDARAIRDRKAR